jgi:hypothetical protein
MMTRKNLRIGIDLSFKNFGVERPDSITERTRWQKQGIVAPRLRPNASKWYSGRVWNYHLNKSAFSRS